MIKKIKYIISYFLGISLSLGLIFVLSYQEQLQRHAMTYLAEQIELQTGYRVECGPMQFSYPFHWHVDTLTLSSQTGPVLHIEELDAHISPWEWLHKHAVFDAIKIHKLTIETIPTFSAQNTNWETISWYFSLGFCEIDQLHLREPVFTALELNKYIPFISPETPLVITGSGSVRPQKKDIYFDIAVTKAFTDQGMTHLIASLTKHSENNLKLNVRFTEPDTGLIAKHLSLPTGYAYQGTLETVLSEDENLIGDFHLSYAATLGNEFDFSIEDAILGQYGSIKSPFSISNEQFVLSQIEGLLGYTLIKGKCSLTSRGEFDNTSFLLSLEDTKNLPSFEPIRLRQAALDCTLSGTLRSPNIALKLSVESIDTPFQTIEKFTAHSNCLYNNDTLNIALNANFIYQKNPWKLETTAAWNFPNNLIGIQSLHCNSNDQKIDGELQYDIRQKHLVGNLKGQCNLAMLSPWISLSSDNIMNFKMRFYPQEETLTQEADLYIQSPEVNVGGLSIKEAVLTIAIEDLWDEPSTLVQLTSQQAIWNNFNASDITCETLINPAIASSPFSISCQKGKLEAHSHGTWHHNSNITEFNLDSLDGKLNGSSFVLQDPVHLTLNANQFHLTPFFFQIGTGSIYASTESHGDYKHGIARLQNIPMEFIEPFIPNIPAKGTVDGVATILETAYGTMGELQLTLNGLDLQTGVLSPSSPLQGSITANLKDNLLACTGTFTGMGVQPLNLSASIPVSVSLSPPFAAIDSFQPLSARLSAEGRIESLLEFLLPVTTTNLAGHTTFVIDVTGSMTSPKVSGQLTLTNGTFELLGIGASVHNVNANVVINDSKAIMTELTAQGNGNGNITGTGSVDLKYPLFPFNLSFQLNQIPLQPASFATLIANGALNLKGNLQEAVLEGKLISDSVSITMPERVPELAHSVEITYINQQTDSPLPTGSGTTTTASWPLTYNLELDIPKHCMLKSKDWSSEWKGHAHLTGTTLNPLLNGTCKVIKGEYRFNGKSFDISEGTITFSGDPKKKTSLYVIASKDIETIHIEIIAKGSVSDPAIVFRSNPPLSQREILSWILFNRGTSDITSFQGSQLNESITNLNKGNRQPDVLTQIRDHIGIDKIDICRSQDSETNDVSVQVGKYVSQGVLISIHKSITDEANRLSLEADLLKNFKLQAEVGDDKDGQLRLKWRKDY
jgi:translocation and assembly module TamB